MLALLQHFLHSPVKGHLARFLLYTSEQQPYTNGYFKRRDWKENEYRNIIPKELKHDPNECYRHCQKAPERDNTWDIL